MGFLSRVKKAVKSTFKAVRKGLSSLNSHLKQNNKSLASKVGLYNKDYDKDNTTSTHYSDNLVASGSDSQKVGGRNTTNNATSTATKKKRTNKSSLKVDTSSTGLNLGGG